MQTSLSRVRPVRRPGLWSRLRSALSLSRSRARLATLDDHMLREIGVSRDEARAEAERAPWDVPGHWRMR